MDSYENYDLFDFRIPVGFNGDCFDRYLIRLEEMRESLSIITSSLDYLVHFNYIDEVSYVIDDAKIVPPSRLSMKYSMESLIHHFKIYTEVLYL